MSQRLGVGGRRISLRQQPRNRFALLAPVGGRDGGTQWSGSVVDFGLQGVERDKNGGRMGGNVHGNS
jgi:hypothetical protein